MRKQPSAILVVIAFLLGMAFAPIWPVHAQGQAFRFDTLGNLLIKLNAGGSTTVTEASTITQNQSNSALTAAVLYGNDGSADRRILSDSSGNLLVKINAAGTGTSVIQATAANLNATVVGTGTLAVQAASTLQAGTAYAGKVATWADGTLASGAVTSAMTGTTSTSVIGGTASNYVYVTNCTTSNASTTVSTDILLQDGSGGTTLYVLPAPAAGVATTGGGGGSFTFPVPLKVTTTGNGLFAANVTTGSSTKISCQGFKSTTSF